MSLEDQFNAAQAKSKTLAQKPSNDVLLKLYSLFKNFTPYVSDIDFKLYLFFKIVFQ